MRKILRSRDFDYGASICDFINENMIDTSDIISIVTKGRLMDDDIYTIFYLVTEPPALESPQTT